MSAQPKICATCDGTGEVSFISPSTGDWDRDVCDRCYNGQDVAALEAVAEPPSTVAKCPGEDCPRRMNCKRFNDRRFGRGGPTFAFAPYHGDECRQFLEN